MCSVRDSVKCWFRRVRISEVGWFLVFLDSVGYLEPGE